ncbi:glutaredoxin family protein [Dokdonella sp.]|uniref:glutaredoxin family protein n=1 Tax=Dokdonella sp. TaxID=2291710 RepID=UPI001AFD895F|nr:glutaredoxin family protein [Dokdonella sp.]MBO9663501.1 glutaredoxin family protein [Dokdonella sp.]
MQKQTSDLTPSIGVTTNSRTASGGKTWWQGLMKSTAYVVALALFLGLGLWTGPRLHAVYQRVFPEPSYVTGNYDALYRQAGKSVVMFSRSTCPFCREVRELLEREHVDFRELVIDQSADAKRQFEALGGSRVPMLFVGDRRIIGFREETIRQSLESARR